MGNQSEKGEIAPFPDPARNLVFENLSGLYKLSRHRVAKLGCPNPVECSGDYCRELLTNELLVRSEIWTELDDPLAYLNTMVWNGSGRYVKRCGCGRLVDLPNDSEQLSQKLAVDPRRQELNRILISELMSHLNKDERRLFELRVYEERSFDEIAEAFGIKVNTARKRMERLRQKLNELCCVDLDQH